MRLSLLLRAVAVLCPALAGAAPPSVTALYPAGGPAGGSFPLTVTGNLGKTPPQVWTSHPGLVIRPGPKAGTWETALAADVPPGPHLVRFFNSEGSSLPRTFMVGTRPEVLEKEPNDNARQTAEKMPALPVTVNGRLDKAGDADAYHISLQEGRWLVATLHAYGLGSQMDPVLRLLDAQGTEVALSHDSHNLDPLLAYEVKKAGAYVVQVLGFSHPPAADVNLKGSADHVYRLTLTQEAVPRFTWPPGVKRGTTTMVQTLGWNVGPEGRGPSVALAAPQEGEWFPAAPEIATGAEPLRVALHDLPSVLETGPNDKPAADKPIPLPAAFQGCLEHPADEDRYPFAARKGESFHFRVAAANLHSPLDAWLRVEDLQGKILAQADDAKEGVFDPALSWKAPADATYVLAVSDRFQRGGWDYVYQVTTAAPPPQVRATLTDHAIRVEAGKTAEVKVKVELTGKFEGQLHLQAGGLPPGVTAKEVTLPGAKGGEASVQLSATPETVSFAGPVEITVATSPPDAPAMFRAVHDLRGVEPRGDRLINEDSRIWLTVQGKPAPTPPPAVPPVANTVSGTTPAATGP